MPDEHPDVAFTRELAAIRRAENLRRLRLVDPLAAQLYVITGADIPHVPEPEAKPDATGKPDPLARALARLFDNGNDAQDNDDQRHRTQRKRDLAEIATTDPLLAALTGATGAAVVPLNAHPSQFPAIAAVFPGIATDLDPDGFDAA